MTVDKEHIETLLFEKIAGTISDQDDLVVENAISSQPEIRKLWEELNEKMSKPKAKAMLENLDSENAWESIKPRLVKKPASTKLFFKKMAAAAAVLLLAIPLSWYFLSKNTSLSSNQKTIAGQVYLKTDDGTLVEIGGGKAVNIGKTSFLAESKKLSYSAENAGEVQWATLVVPSSKDYKLKLSDGTEIWLNSTSSIRFPSTFSAGKREVYLTGEAYFQVAKDKNHEFIVHTDHAEITVHGTSFNVNAYPKSAFTAALVEGSISAKRGSNKLLLKAGQEVMIGANNKFNVHDFDAQEVLGWMKGTYFFHNKSIEQIAPVISRWFDVKVNWDNVHIAGQTFTGEIDRTLPLSVVIANLQLSSGIKAELKNGVLTFK